MHEKENYLKIPASQKLLLMEQLLNTLSPQIVANILNERLRRVTEDGHCQKNGQGFVGSRDKGKAEKLVSEMNRVLIQKIKIGVDLSQKVKLIIVKSIKDDEPFYQIQFAPVFVNSQV